MKVKKIKFQKNYTIDFVENQMFLCPNYKTRAISPKNGHIWCFLHTSQLKKQISLSSPKTENLRYV